MAAGSTVNARSPASWHILKESKRDTFLVVDIMPANLRTTGSSGTPRFGRVSCLDAEAFAQLCARLDPIQGSPGELSEGLPVCRAPAMKEHPPTGREWARTSRTCWDDDDEDFSRAGASDALGDVLKGYRTEFCKPATLHVP